jgi:hypothetical protein
VLYRLRSAWRAGTEPHCARTNCGGSVADSPRLLCNYSTAVYVYFPETLVLEATGLRVPQARAYSLAAVTAFALTIHPVAALAQNTVGNAALPRDLTPWGMFVHADKGVKAVLIGFAFASVITWTVSLAKTVEIVLAKRRVRAALTAVVRPISEGIEPPAGHSTRETGDLPLWGWGRHG